MSLFLILVGISTLFVINNHRRSNILRGEELIAAEGWLVISRSMQPPATELHRTYIVFSRSTNQTLQNLIYSGIGIIVLLVFVVEEGN
jgi:hypothetical protein